MRDARHERRRARQLRQPVVVVGDDQLLEVEFRRLHPAQEAAELDPVSDLQVLEDEEHFR